VPVVVTLKAQLKRRPRLDPLHITVIGRNQDDDLEPVAQRRHARAVRKPLQCDVAQNERNADAQHGEQQLCDRVTQTHHADTADATARHRVAALGKSAIKNEPARASVMDRSSSSLLPVAVAAMAVCFSICVHAASVEHDQPTIEGALARVSAARVSAEAGPLALEEALTALGDAYLEANRYSAAEAAYAEAVRSAEQHGGAETQRVLAPLTGLGNTFARAGHHHDAVPILQRAVAITRAQLGMFDVRQQDVLKTLAVSLTALDRESEAQDAMVYRVRIAEKMYGEANPKVIPSLCDLGNWFADIGKTPESRLTFYTALNIVGTTESLNAPIIVEPLRGIARAWMLRPSYPDEWRKDRYPELGCAIPRAVDPPACRVARLGADGRLFVEPRTMHQEGEDALKRALRILESDPDSPPQTLIETLLQMGDLYQIKESPREALPYYERAWQLIRTTPKLPDSVATALNVPVRVYYPTPQIVASVPKQVAAVDTQSHYVQMEFTVAADGSVRDARIVDRDTRDRYAREILKAVSESRFRPKFVDGKAVAASGITYREVFWTGKPRA
jgi:tetratricopeptide (TPR) repeat protein